MNATNDLVNRLRNVGDHAGYAPHLHHEAADEIERLTAERDALVAAAYAAAGVRARHLWYDSADADEVEMAINNFTPADALAAQAARDERKDDLWRKNSRATFEALCAMRDSINEYIPLPSLESDLLRGPENSVFCETVATAVISAHKAAEARIAKLVEALKFYAAEDSYLATYTLRDCGCCSDSIVPIEDDAGEIARAALQENGYEC